MSRSENGSLSNKRPVDTILLLSTSQGNNPKHNEAFAAKIAEMRAEAAQRKAAEAAAAEPTGDEPLKNVELEANVDNDGQVALSVTAS